ncbi:hypothetical protein [Actinomadura formosensis]|uniref:hypothetical protein n=1 Tax=Actinomadura formosensis TaxID=60706 RepID=UPI00082BB4BA|nr:hypothetical protein [Actinomadura formosensis]
MSGSLKFVFGGRYDRLADVPEVAARTGIALELETLASPKDAFAALRDSPDVAGGEMSVSFYMTERSRLRDACDLVALPVWVSRAFRHSNIYVRRDSGLRTPADLRGKRIGLPEYGMTMAVWLRGLFADEYGLAPGDVRWITHRAATGLTEDAVKYPSGVEIVAAPPGRSPQRHLLSGHIDAWIGAGVAPPAPGVRRLFEDPFAEEREYFAKSGVFPVMHVLVVKRDVLDGDRSLAPRLFAIFDESKRRAQERLWSTGVAYSTLPWALQAAEEQTRFMGGDPWPYGLAANAPTLDALMRYMDQQGLLWDDLPLNEFFLPLEPA